jgi:hypothetical protein
MHEALKKKKKREKKKKPSLKGFSPERAFLIFRDGRAPVESLGKW